MIGRTNVGGGGVGTAFAYIGVTYPAGATLTCSDGRKTLRAKDTTGLYVFEVPYAATWTVTAIDGADIASNDVVITTLWQDVVVNLAFVWDGILFDNGDQRTSITGGWDYNNKISATAAYSSYNVAEISDTINIVGTIGNKSCYVTTKNKIDFTDAVSITVYSERASNMNGNIFLSLTNSGYASDITTQEFDINGSGEKTLTLSLPSYMDHNQYVTIGIFSTHYIEISKMQVNFS